MRVDKMIIEKMKGDDMKGDEMKVDKMILFVSRLNIPVNQFSVMSGWSQRFLDCREFMCLAQENKTTHCHRWGLKRK